MSDNFTDHDENETVDNQFDDCDDYAYSDVGDNDDEEYEKPLTVTKTDDSNVGSLKLPDGGYKVLDYEDIVPLMTNLTSEVSGLLNLTIDEAQILLSKFKWDKERLIDSYYTDNKKLLIDSGIVTESESTVSESIDKNTNIYCRICCEDHNSNNTFHLGCGHKFCRNCYGEYLRVHIHEGPSCIVANCPEYKCRQRITISSIQQLLDEKNYNKYYMYITKNFIDTSKTMRWCPAPGCEKVVVGSGITMVKCSCSYYFCFRCGEEAHDPAACEQLKDWLEKCTNESETANWILANTKKCPQCNTRIEKNQGCNHITCKLCKHEFCWICMGSWTDHGSSTGGYYKCNRYDNKVDGNASAAQKARAELDRYLHYYQRYHAHAASLLYAANQRENAERNMVLMQETDRSAWIDVQFLKQAVDQVIDCRRVLKYTYVLGYFLQDASSEKQLFEHHQEMLEKNTEKLSEYTEVGTQNIDRTQVVNLTRVTERFMNSLLTSMMDGGVHEHKDGSS